jgi:hypothetical protein
MAIRIEIIADALVLTDTETTLEVFETSKRFVYYDVRKLNSDDLIVITEINSFVSEIGNNSLYELPFSNAVNNLGQAFTKASLKSFFRNNIGV